NMPAERLDYRDTVLIGWGALFRRDLPEPAFARYAERYPVTGHDFWTFADVVFAMLTPWKRVDFGFEHLPCHDDDTRIFRQPGYEEKKAEFFRRARDVRRSAPRQRYYYGARRGLQRLDDGMRAVVSRRRA